MKKSLSILLSFSLLFPLSSLNTEAQIQKSYTSKDLIKNPSLVYEVGERRKAERKALESIDSDHDGLNNLIETNLGLDPQKTDSDKDKKLDKDEDTDQDGLSNLKEVKINTNPAAKDTDFDGLSDFTEANILKSNPLEIDSNNNGIKDGLDKIGGQTSYDSKKGLYKALIPKNKWNIQGSVIGTGYIPHKFQIRETPILLLQQTESNTKFDLMSTDSSLTFELAIPIKDSSYNPKLYRYKYQNKKSKKNAELELVENQKFDKGSKAIHAKVTGGDSFIVLSESKIHLVKNTKSILVESLNKSQHDIKIKGFPDFKINKNAIDKNGIYSIKKKVYDTTQKKEVLLEAQYKISSAETTTNTTYVSMQPRTSESGLPYTFLIHGWTGDSTTFGFENGWSPSDENYSKANLNLSGSQSFTGKSFNVGDTQSLNNPDVHFITNIKTDVICDNESCREDPNNPETNRIGIYLASDSRSGGLSYTPNVDLFLFEYQNDFSDVFLNAHHLDSYIKNLKNMNIIPDNAITAIVAHSMGGLVSRYFIENIDQQGTINKLITIGTPHFGVQYSPVGDLGRNSSCFWDNQPSSNGCVPLTGVHPNTKYSFYAGSSDSKSSQGMTHPPHFDVIKNSYGYKSYEEYYTKDPSWTNVFGGELMMGDGVVSVDSALGSDGKYTGTPKPPIKANRLYLRYTTGNPENIHSPFLLSDTEHILPQVFNDLYSTGEPYLERISGANRYATSANVSKKLYPNGTKNIVIASGELYPDALSGGPLAALKGGPLLLTQKAVLPSEIKNEIQRLKPTHATILGSDGAVSIIVEQEIKNLGISTERIGGANRFETSAKIAEKIYDAYDPAIVPNEAFVVSGLDFPDGLIASSPASQARFPILLVGNSLPIEIENVIKSRNMKEFITVSTNGKIPQTVRDKLATYGKVSFISGSNIYQTAVKLHEHIKLISGLKRELRMFHSLKFVFAAGTNFPDGLSGGPLAAAQHASIILVPTESLPPEIDSLFQSQGISMGYILGSTGAVSSNVETRIKQWMIYFYGRLF